MDHQNSTSGLMQAAIVTGPGRVRVEARPVPSPEVDEVRIRLEGCGVCASNLGPWAGPDWMHFPTEPGALGHEGWGVVDAVGANVTAIRPGERVAALSHNAYAHYDLAREQAVVKLPDELVGLPFPGEPLGCAMNIFRRSRIKAGDTVAIIGIGFLGALLTQLAVNEGAEVIALSRREFSLRTAQTCGAHHSLPLDDHWAIIEQVQELTQGRFCDIVIEATGKAWPLDLAAELTKERGRLIIAGYHQDGPRQINMQLWNWRGLDVINAHERDPARYRQGMEEAVAATLKGRFDPQPLLTHCYGLEELAVALNATRDRPEGFLKAWLKLS
ncbi:MDR/zinc-dependent alcohol dehydrogenase-like family protein [Allorhizobium undicola]|uniref:MDR/zinc-dependent alcohol dehydrogenase-like family protein n=1 Tax=Allorhizobium undicola TaxID=78527 RepID=UPI00048428D2|nr:zinc-binding dehydrogenase [Allorhizobium undicola]